MERKREVKQRQKDILAAKEVCTACEHLARPSFLLNFACILIITQEWKVEAERTMAEQEAADLNAGRVRLADLDSDDDYDYGGKRGHKKKGRRKGKSRTSNNDVVQTQEDNVGARDSAIVTDANETDDHDGDGDFYEKKINETFDGGAIEDELCNGVDDIDLSSNACTSHDSLEEEEEEEQLDGDANVAEKTSRAKNNLRTTKEVRNTSESIFFLVYVVDEKHPILVE
jgi:hypothetical protein